MKKTLAMALSILSLAFNSCDDNDDKTIVTIQKSGFVLQEGSGADATFTPYFYFYSSDANEPLETFEVTPIEKGVKLQYQLGKSNVYLTTGEQSFKSPCELNGIYNVKAETANHAFDIDFSLEYDLANDTLTEVILKDFKFETQTISATIMKLANAYEIGFAITPYNTGEKPSYNNTSFIRKAINPYFNNGTLSISYPFSTNSENLLVDYVDVSVYVATYYGVFRLSETKTLEKNAKAFLEEK